MFTKFKELAGKKKQVVDEDLEALVTEGILRLIDATFNTGLSKNGPLKINCLSGKQTLQVLERFCYKSFLQTCTLSPAPKHKGTNNEQPAHFARWRCFL